MREYRFAHSSNPTGGPEQSSRSIERRMFQSTPSLPVRILFCIAIIAGLLLAAPAGAADFATEDCTCPSSGFSGKAETAGSTKLDCSWYRQGSSSYTAPPLISVVTRYPDSESALARIRDTNAYNRETISAEKKISRDFSCIEDTYGSTRSSSICGVRGSYKGLRSIVYRDTYLIELGAEGFGTGQAVKSSIDSLESCMKRAADAHAAKQSGGSGPASVGTSQPRPVTGASAAMDVEDSLDDLLSDMGDEINEDLPLPVNWAAVPGAIGNSVTPAAAGAIGALVGGIAGALIIQAGRIPWPAGNAGGGSEPPGGPPALETGAAAQEPGGEPPAEESPAALSAEPGLPAPAVPPAASVAATPLADGPLPGDAAPAAATPAVPAVIPGTDPVTGKRVLTAAEEELRDHIKQMIERSQREAEEWNDFGTVAGWYDTGATAVTTAADITLDIGSVLSPGTGSMIKSIYSATKTTLSRASESYIGGEGFWWGMGKGAIEAAADKALDAFGGKITEWCGGKVPVFGEFKAPEGVDLGNVSPTEICSRLLDTNALPDTKDALQLIRNKATKILNTDEAREAMANALANLFQGKIQGRIFCDPLKQLLGISTPE